MAHGRNELVPLSLYGVSAAQSENGLLVSCIFVLEMQTFCFEDKHLPIAGLRSTGRRENEIRVDARFLPGENAPNFYRALRP